MSHVKHYLSKAPQRPAMGEALLVDRPKKIHHTSEITDFFHPTHFEVHFLSYLLVCLFVEVYVTK